MREKYWVPLIVPFLIFIYSFSGSYNPILWDNLWFISILSSLYIVFWWKMQIEADHITHKNNRRKFMIANCKSSGIEKWDVRGKANVWSLQTGNEHVLSSNLMFCHSGNQWNCTVICTPRDQNSLNCLYPFWHHKALGLSEDPQR